MKKRVLISGSSGFLGKAISYVLKKQGYEVISLVRKSKKKLCVFWDYENGYIEKEKLVDIDIAIFLSGASIWGLWTQSKRKKIYDSRVKASKFLVEMLIAHAPKLQYYLSSSAVGIYKSQKNEEITENSALGKGFLSKVCIDWEKQVEKIHCPYGFLRFSMVLDKKGGALKKMILAFRFMLGGKIGTGKQYISWVSLEDAANIACFCIQKKIQGAVNVCAPDPISQEQFGKCLAKKLKKPFWLHIGERGVNLFLPKMAKEVFLSSIRAVPKKLIDLDYHFMYVNFQKYLEEKL